jgi:hypothetical protein
VCGLRPVPDAPLTVAGATDFPQQLDELSALGLAADPIRLGRL